MRVRLRPGLRLLWRDANTLQIGRGTNAALVVADPSPQDLNLLNKLQFHGVTHDRANPLLQRLHSANLLLSQARFPVVNVEHSFRTRLAPDSGIWAIDDPRGHGWPALLKRRKSHVGVRGLGRIGSQLVRLLAQAGVGRFSIWDDAPIAPQDAAPGGHSSEEAGRRRDQALAETIEAEIPDSAVQVSAESEPDLQVLLGHYVIDPSLYEELVRNDIPHLPVVVSDGQVSIGPLVLPGDSPCLRCLDLHRTDADSAWPVLANQLLGLAPAELPAEETVLAAAASSLAAAQVLSYLAQRRAPATVAHTLEFGTVDYLPALRKWNFHPDCGCAAL